MFIIHYPIEFNVVRGSVESSLMNDDLFRTDDIACASKRYDANGCYQTCHQRKTQKELMPIEPCLTSYIDEQKSHQNSRRIVEHDIQKAGL